MRKLLFTCLATILCTMVQAQQLPHYSQYMLNGFLVNPAVAGSENYVDVKMGWRNQWTGLEGAPESMYLTAHLPLNKTDNRATASSFPSRWQNGRKALYEEYRKKDFHREQGHHGAGLTVQLDKAGVLKRSDAGLTYAYHLPVSRSLKLAGGFSAGVSVYKVDQSRLKLTDPNDPTYTSGYHDRVQPNITVGTLLYSKRYYVGATAAQLFQDELALEENQGNDVDRAQAHYALTGGYKVVLSPAVSLLPSTLIKYVPSAPVAADVNLKVLYRDFLWAGASYRKR
ncbi:type IX secretion system membrane protein PorP/SprF, partial [Pontibacter sp. Tf4]|uniref:PorP/SprF family type IX secretion system membrane protein n=1 Tax=Pontibacter sp. Tf4 TaxID=2761620 RepID=UPI00162AC023